MSILTSSPETFASHEEFAYDLVVSLGTDYHRFDRLVNWVEAFLDENPQLTCLFQHGFTDCSIAGVEAVERMPRQELLTHYERAKVVLVQGGPGSILDAREVGVIPFAVPRLKKFDEVVDDHQVQFAETMQSYGEAVVIESEADLFEKLSVALQHPETVRSYRRNAECDAAALNLGQALSELNQAKPNPIIQPSRFIRRTSQMIRGLVR